MQTPSQAQQRTEFIGRVQEQRQFLMVLGGLLVHHQTWYQFAQARGPNFNPEQAPGDDSYANIFLPHGIGGIGKSWLTRRCLDLAAGIPNEPPILTLYDDVSLGAPVLEPLHLLDRLAEQLTAAGYESYLPAYHQAKADLPPLVERVTRYQFENREAWERMLKIAADFVARHRHEPEAGYRSFAEISLAYTHASGAEAAGKDAPTLAHAYDQLLEKMQQEGRLAVAEAALFRNPPATQAAHLIRAIKRIAAERPLVIGLDNLEIIVPLEPLIRDCLVLPTNHAPLIWILSGRYNLADERVVEISGEQHVFKGYRDLLGENPPVVWDMSIFGDADLRDYLQAEAERRRAPLIIDDQIIEAVKATSSGVPLVVEMVADALFTMERSEFLRDFALHDRGLLPGDRLDKITARFLRYCLTQPEDLERVQALALLRKDADEPAMAALWNLPAGRSVTDVLHGLRARYAFVRPEGLHDAVYEFVRRQLRTSAQDSAARERLSRRAVDHYRAGWQALHHSFDDPTLRVRDRAWQRVTRHLLNALLWFSPDEAVDFLLPRFIEGLGFDRAFSNGLLLQAEEFLSGSVSTFSRAYANLLHRMRMGLQDIDWTFDEPGEAVGAMVEILLDAPGLDSLHLSILHLWQGNWLAENGRYAEALAAYLQADTHRPADAVGLGRQLGKAFYELSSRFLWPESAAETVVSEPGLQAAGRAVQLDPDNGAAWFNLGVALDYLGREAEATPAYEKAIAIEPRPVYYNNLGDVYSALGRDDDALAAYRQALELDPAYAWPYHSLGQLHAGRGDYESALDYYQQAIDQHQRDKDRAISWDSFGDAHATLGNFEEAISAYRWAGILHPQFASPWFGLGNVYSRLERYPEAIDAYRRAITLDPDAAWARHNLGLAYLGQGDAAAAAPCFQQAIERHHTDEERALAWIGLGDAYSSAGRHNDAITAYRQALELDPQQAEAWHSLGNVYHARGDETAAIEAYRQAVTLTPEYAAAWNSLATLYGTLGRFDEAIEAYGRVIDLEPDFAWPYNNLGFIYARRGEHDQAIKLYRQAIERHRDDDSRAVSWSNLGDAQLALDNRDEAIYAYNEAITLSPNYAWPYHNLAVVYELRGQERQAIELYRQAIERHSREADRAKSWQRLADVYQRQERHGEAIDAYREVLLRDRENAIAWNSLGDSYLNLARYQEAGEAFRRAIELQPDFGQPYHNLGLIYTDYGNHESALDYYRQAVERHTDNRAQAISLNKLGDSHLALGNSEQAVQAYRRAMTLAPDFAWPYHSLAAIYESRSDYQSALTLYQQAIERHRQDKSRALSWNGLGNVYQALGRTTEAVNAYRQAGQLDPIYAAPWRSLGDVYRQQNKLTEAANAYQRAIDLEPTHPRPYHHLGLVYLAQRDYDSANRRLEQAIARYGDEQPQARADAWYQRGQAYRGLARYESALNAYRQAIDLNPNFADPWVSAGDVNATLERYDEAVEAYRRAVELEPAAAQPWNSLGDVYRVQEQYNQAAQAYRRAIELEPDFAWPYHNLGLINEIQQRYESAINYFEQAIKRQAQPKARALSWDGLGNIYQAQQRNEQAVSAYQKAIELDPDLASAYHGLGQVYHALEQYEPAILRYQQAIERYEDAFDQATVWKDLGDSLAQVGRWDEAIDALQQAMDLDDEYARPWHSLGNVYRLMGRLEDAGRAYERAIELEPDYAWAYHNLGLAQQQLGRLDRAGELYRQAVEHHEDNPGRAVSWNSLGNVHSLQRQYAEAVEAYRQAISLDPRYARPWNNLGDVYRAQGVEQGVAQAYQRAIELEPDFAWPYHNLGALSKNKGAYAPALTYYQQALERHLQPQDKSASWNGLGDVYRAQQQYDKAVDAYQNAIKLNPADGWPHHNLGYVYKIQEKYHQAITSYQQAIDLFDANENKAISWNNLGNVYSALRRYQDAINAYQQSIELNPDYALPWNSLGEVYRRQQRPDEAIRAFKQALKRDSGYVLAWTNLGDVYRLSRRFDEAIEAYEQAIRLDARYAWPYHHLGAVYEERGDYESATEYYRQAIDRHQNNEQKAVLWDNTGGIYRLMGQSEQAIEAYRRSTALDPNYASPWYSLGNIYAALEQDDEAINAYRQAIAINPADPWPYHNLALVYEKMENYDQAIALYRQAIERHATDYNRAVSWDSLGNVYSDAGRYEEAVQAFQEAIRLNPKYALPWNSLGDVYNALGNRQQAIAAYQQAIALDPGYAWPYNNLGMVYQTIGQYEQAIGAYRQVIDKHASNHDRAISWNNLGDVYRELQREAEAIEAYEQAIRLDPDYAWPYNSLGAIYEKRGDHDQAYALYRQATHRHRQRALV